MFTGLLYAVSVTTYVLSDVLLVNGPVRLIWRVS